MAHNKKNLKRKFSQVFLEDGSVLARIADSINASERDGVIEIGPGKGALTKYLVKKAGKVLSIEIDPEMIEKVNEKLSDVENLKVVNEDILKSDLLKYIEEFKGFDKLWLVGNLPYDIGTAIISKSIEHHTDFTAMVFMLQKEVIDRLLAKPGNKEFGYISIVTDYFFSKRRIMNVSPNSFRPRPAVQSAVIELVPRETGHSREFEKKMIELFKASFSQKRKTILNNLSNNMYSEGNKDRLREILSASGIEPERRAEAISLTEFIHLMEKIDSI